MPPKPATARATSSAACGGQTERITSACPDISPAEPTSRIPAAAARSAVAGLRPADAHSTVSPRWLRQPPTAAPISPGCSTPITFLSTIASGDKSRPCRNEPGGVYQVGQAFGPGLGAPGSGVNRLPSSTPNSMPYPAVLLLCGSLTGRPGLWARTISLLPEEFVHSTSWICPGYIPGIGHRPRTRTAFPVLAENSVKASSLDSGCLARSSVAATILLPSGVMMALKPKRTLLIFPCT